MPSKPQQETQDPGAALIEATETVRDIFAYPAAAPSAPPGDTPPSAPAALGGTGRLAEDTIRQALGWRYRPEDVRGFKSALTRSFTLKEDIEGRVEWKWTPQTYAVQADMGEITGAQASILEQARVTINYVLPLVDGLKALRVDNDPEDTNAITGIVRLKLNTILTELGRVGGPCVQRVDLAFEELLGIPVIDFNAPTGVVIKDSDEWIDQLEALPTEGKEPYSLLYQLSQEFGLLPGLANTIEEERNLTNSLILVDSVIALRTGWLGKRSYFDRNDTTKQRFLGTQLVWISRQLEVVGESVRDAYSAMDSVYFGPQEREATDIYYVFKPGDSNEPDLNVAPITVGDLLEWVYSFATQEGPQLLEDGGKDGVLAFRSTLSRLTEWVEAARQFSERGRGRAPRSFFTARVQLALREIEHQLEITESRAKGITRHARQPAQNGAEIADLADPPNSRVESVGKPPRSAEPPTPPRPGFGTGRPPRAGHVAPPVKPRSAAATSSPQTPPRPKSGPENRGHAPRKS